MTLRSQFLEHEPIIRQMPLFEDILPKEKTPQEMVERAGTYNPISPGQGRLFSENQGLTGQQERLFTYNPVNAHP
jgi:hypothetical protein